MSTTIKSAVKSTLQGLTTLTLLILNMTFAAEVGECQPVAAPETLERYIDLAIKQNPDLMAARARWQQSDARVNQAYSSLYPKIDVNGNYTNFSGGRIITLPGLGTFSTASIAVVPWDNNISATWNIFNWAAWEAPKTAKAYLDAATSEVSTRELALGYQVAQAYYGYASASELVSIRENALELSKQNLATTVSLVNAEKAQKNDQLRAEVAVASAEGDILTAKNQQNLAKTNFNNLLKRNYDADIDLPPAQALADGAKDGTDLALNSSPSNLQESTSIDQDLHQAMQVRPEVAELDEAQTALEGARSISIADNVPNVSVFARYGYQENSPTFAYNEHYVMAGATLHWNLFTGFNTKAKVDENDAQIAEVEFQKESVADGIRMEVQNARLTLENARERRLIAVKQLQSAEENRRITKAQYDQGVVPLITMIDAETTLANSKANLITTTYDVLTAQAGYRKALGQR
jgi:outer membrane protein TolC